MLFSEDVWLRHVDRWPVYAGPHQPKPKIDQIRKTSKTPETTACSLHRIRNNSHANAGGQGSRFRRLPRIFAALKAFAEVQHLSTLPDLGRYSQFALTEGD
jgi:hypothetical protein